MNLLSEFQNALAWIAGFRISHNRKKNLFHLLLLAAMATLTTGVLLFIIDPGVRTPLDGIWGAWITMTHVGYGDVVPTSFVGRLLAAALVLVGIILFSLFTAIISVELLGRDVNTLGSNVERVEGAENQILLEIKRLHQRLNEIEKKLP